jgi:hypothetical protein
LPQLLVADEQGPSVAPLSPAPGQQKQIIIHES